MNAYILLLSMLLPLSGLAQTISGTVTNDEHEPLPGASVYWLGTTVGVSTGSNGEFVISTTGISTRMLIARYVGHSADTVDVTDRAVVEFHLRDTHTLDEVVVRSQREGIYLSDLTPMKTEQITQTELAKAACCDLAGCFETQATVQPQTTNVLTDAKELRILGLSGVYNQVLFDGFPMVQGLSYTYGISSIPGSLVDNIFVAKGANSVLQGYEGISGQINVETREPENSDRININAYMNGSLEKQGDISYGVVAGDWSSLTAVHTLQPARRIDRDNDTFLDIPLLTRYMIFSKLNYGHENEQGWNSRLAVRLFNERRIGGQSSFDASRDGGSTGVYGQIVNIDQPEVRVATGYRFDEMHRIAAHASAFHQQQDAFFGTVSYDARQTSVYGNIQYELTYDGNELTTGFSFRHMDLNEEVGFTATLPPRTYAGNYRRLENIPGLFAEHTLRLFDGSLTWIAGVRGDHHNQSGFQFTPRTLLKYDITPQSIVRASIGTGWRTVNVFSENISLLVSSRDIHFASALRPEKAVNYGINATQKFETTDENVAGYVSADFYRTDFQNQIFPDYDSDPTKVIIDNFTGTSVSNGFQAEAAVTLFKEFEVKMGYSFLDVYREIAGERQLLPFNSRHNVLATLGYRPQDAEYHVDMNIHWYGKQRLPDTKSNPVEYRRPDVSSSYAVVNAQVTYDFSGMELYAGCENVFDYRQLRPIIGWQDPFGPYFDTSSAWGPTQGREVYVGVRVSLERSEE